MEHWLSWEARYDELATGFEHALQSAADISATDRVLDVGCGTGQSTRNAARAASAGTVLGVDLEAALIERARRRVADEGLRNVEHRVLDAQGPIDDVFDVIISRFGATFFSDPAKAFGQLCQELRPGGRLVMVAWRLAEHNEWLRLICAAVAPNSGLPDVPSGTPGPFGLADEAYARAVLAASGYAGLTVTEIAVPMRFGADVDDAHQFLRSFPLVVGLTSDLTADDQEHAIQQLRMALAAHDGPAGVWLDSSAWLITAHRK